MAKEKLKLTDEQKRWASNLQWYAENKIFWAGPTDERFFKEKALEGRYAIFSIRGEPVLNHFDWVNCADTFEGAMLMGKWNLHTVYQIVDLEMLMIDFEGRRAFKPSFDMLVEKWEHDSRVLRYKELKKTLKPILKHFKDLR